MDSVALSGQQLIDALIDKLHEESAELTAADSPASELADLQQIIDDLTILLGTTSEDIKVKQATKLSKNGGFLEGRFVRTVTCDENDEWATYYRREPERFPETS